MRKLSRVEFGDFVHDHSGKTGSERYIVGVFNSMIAINFPCLRFGRCMLLAHMPWLPCLIAFKVLLFRSVAGFRRQCFGRCTAVIFTVFRSRVTELLALAAPRLLVLRITGVLFWRPIAGSV